MKSYVFTALVLLVLSSAAQNKTYQIPEPSNPVIKVEKLAGVNYVTDLSPLLWSSLQLPHAERYNLEQRRENEYPQPPNYVFPQEKYKQTIDYVSVEISVEENGQKLTAKSNSDKLSTEQKSIMAKAGLGAQIGVTIKYKYKNQTEDKLGARNKVVEGSTNITVVPASEAQFPGGYKQLSNYFTGQVLNKTTDNKASVKMQMVVVKFTVTEDGEVVNPQLARSSDDAALDKLIIQALAQMPKWKPAQNATGARVKQQLTITMGNGGC